jgi:hypothetical protein
VEILINLRLGFLPGLAAARGLLHPVKPAAAMPECPGNHRVGRRRSWVQRVERGCGSKVLADGASRGWRTATAKIDFQLGTNCGEAYLMDWLYRKWFFKSRNIWRRIACFPLKSVLGRKGPSIDWMFHQSFWLEHIWCVAVP